MSSKNASISAGEDSKPKRRNRKAASCNPCRARRSRCDRAKPCSACVARKDEHSCVWDSNAVAPLYDRREANETENLKNEVDRLQRLVDVLVSTTPVPDPLGLSLSPPAYPASEHPTPPAFVPPAVALAKVVEPSLTQQLPEDPKDDEVESADLVRHLSDLTLKTFHLGGVPPEEHESHVEEAKHLLDVQSATDRQSHNPLLTSPSTSSSHDTLSLLPVSTTPTTTQELMQRIPSKALIDRTVAGYFRYITWYIHVLPRSTYQSHEDAVLSAKAAEKPAPPISLAICFVVWALGLYGSDESGPTYSKYSQTDLSVKLVELSRNALAIGRFLETPSVCSIRALLLLAVHYAVLALGEDGGRGIGLLALAIQGCLQLDLHRDPEKRRPDLTFAEKEDRRRVFWTTRLKDAEVASVMGRRFTLIRARDCDTKLPLDIDDDKLDELDFQPTREETSMSASLVRMRIAHLTEQITEEVFGLHPVSYSRVIVFDREIAQLEENLPAFFKLNASHDSITLATTKALVINLAILQERLRLHRPYLSRAFVDSKYKYSRDVCVNTAKQVLSLQTHPALNSGWACMTFKAIAASVVLLVDLMYDPGNEGAEAWKGMIRETISRLSVYKNISTICRRGTKLLGFLLQKLETNVGFRLNDEDGPLPKRVRPSLNSTRSAPQGRLPHVGGVDVDVGGEAKHKRLRAFSVGTSSEGSVDTASLRSKLPLPSTHSRKTISTASSSSLFSTFSLGGSSNFGDTSPSHPFTSFPSTSPPAPPQPVSVNSSTASMYSVANEIATLDLPALLGIDGNEAPFSFDFALPSAAPPVPPSMAEVGRTNTVREMSLDAPSTALHEAGAWSSFLFSSMSEPSPGPSFSVGRGGSATAVRAGGEQGGGEQEGDREWEGWSRGV